MQVNDLISFQRFLRENDIFNRFGLDRIGIFGSFVRGGKYNDIDLLLDKRIKYRERRELKDILEHQLQVPVDIMIKDFAEPIILNRALKEVKYATAT